MIYTITFNPSVDYVMYLNSFSENRINRSQRELYYPGGKGINVSVVLKNLGFESTALGFVSGFCGSEIIRMLNNLGCENNFIKTDKGCSRINVKIRVNDGETDINGEGPIIEEKDIEKLFTILESVCDNDYIVLAGSVPKTFPENIYENILEKFEGRKINTVVDTTGKFLLKTLKYRPFLIKPNHIELGEIFKKKFSDKKEIIFYAKKLQDMGARNIIVSLAENGAVMLAENKKIYSLNAPKGKLVNSVGAGDSMVAGFIAEFIETSDYEKAFKKAVVSGSASAFKVWLAKKDDIDRLMKENTVLLKNDF